MAAPVVVILAAGKGTRMRSETPKLLHPICGRPMIGWPVAAARAAGAAKIVVVDAPGRPLAEALEDDVTVVIQEQALGTGHAVRAAEAHFSAGSTVLAINGDAPLISAETIAALVAAREAAGAAATLTTAIFADPSGYGRVVRDSDGDVAKVVETKHPGDATPEELEIREINAGIYAFDGGLLAAALARVGTDNAQGEYYLPDAVSILRADGGRVTAFTLADAEETLGVNDRVQLAAVTQAAQARINRRHMRNGVTLIQPQSTFIDADVELAADVVIEPGSALRGPTIVAAGAVIGPHTTLIAAEVGERSRVIHSYVELAVIKDDVSVGPFAYLRPGTVLRDGSKAGTFVEIKNSDVGAGTKIPHLSYIGDADVGEHTNLGAATITANYDGKTKRKSRTTIGAHARTSVDTTLIAPVSLGDGAFTAAGSVIGQDVPAGALAGSPGVARRAQRTIEGYGDTKKAPETSAS